MKFYRYERIEDSEGYGDYTGGIVIESRFLNPSKENTLSEIDELTKKWKGHNPTHSKQIKYELIEEDHPEKITMEGLLEESYDILPEGTLIIGETQLEGELCKYRGHNVRVTFELLI